MPVINPWVFYLMHVADGAKYMGVIVTVAGVVAALAYVLYCQMEFEDPKPKVVKAALTVAAVSLAVYVLVPNSNTITKMIVAQNVTHERVEDAADTVQKVYDDIMGLFEEGG